MPSEMDPVESFLGAPSSAFGRVGLGAAVIAAAMLLHACTWGWRAFEAIFALLPVYIFCLALWAEFYPLLFAVGVAALLGLLVTFFVSLRGECGKRGYFALFAFSAVYFLPVSVHSIPSTNWRWLFALILFVSVSAFYWLAAPFVEWYVAKNEPEAIGPPPKTAMQAAWEKQSAHAPGQPPAAGR